MNSILNASTRLPRLNKTKLLLILAITGAVIAATFLRADSSRNQPEHNTLAGTWITTDPGSAGLNSYMSDGRVIDTGAINILTGNGPGGTSELASPAVGEWIRTGHHEFAATLFSVLSSPDVGFTHLVKLTNTLKLNETGDELTLTGATVTVFFPDGTVQFGPFPAGGIPLHLKRVVVGQ